MTPIEIVDIEEHIGNGNGCSAAEARYNWYAGILVRNRINMRVWYGQSPYDQSHVEYVAVSHISQWPTVMRD
ncbi:MAG: hypothetical protein A4E19_09085 [Nitrospira sp. SG-bin1]|nr:MAG: hypothetical protein A4E19_09085 [Nitrospira sp. SG-bin1]